MGVYILVCWCVHGKGGVWAVFFAMFGYSDFPHHHLEVVCLFNGIHCLDNAGRIFKPLV